jgi:signal peptidase II
MKEPASQGPKETATRNLPTGDPRPGPQPGRIRWLPEVLLLGALTCSLAAADQWTKGWAVQRLGPLRTGPGERVRPPRHKEPLELIPGWFRCQITGNTGAIFGLARDWPRKVKRPLFIGLNGLAMLFICLLIYWSRPEQRPRRLGLAAVLSGAVGNLIDRVRLDYVVDFLDWYGGVNWPTFNVADAAITVGVALVLVDLFLHPDPPPDPAADPDAPAGSAADTEAAEPAAE